MPSKRLLEMAKKHEERTGYSKLTAEERVELNEKCLDKLAGIDRGDYEIGKMILDPEYRNKVRKYFDNNYKETDEEKEIFESWRKLRIAKGELTYHERLVENYAIDLKDNCIVIDLGNGYSKIGPINKNKFVK